jgi:8-oxo-dGTP diphosphatase
VRAVWLLAMPTNRFVSISLNYFRSSMRSVVEFLMGVWPVNRLITLIWRYFPFPKGVRPWIMRSANDRFLVGVMAVIQDERHRIFLVRNTYDPRYSWSLPGGWMGRNEHPEDCIRREIAEETGYQIEIGRLVSTKTHSRLPSVDIVFSGKITGGSFRKSAEIVEARFFDADELPEGLTPIHKRLLEWAEVIPGSSE